MKREDIILFRKLQLQLYKFSNEVLQKLAKDYSTEASIKEPAILDDIEYFDDDDSIEVIFSSNNYMDSFFIPFEYFETEDVDACCKYVIENRQEIESGLKDCWDTDIN